MQTDLENLTRVLRDTADDLGPGGGRTALAIYALLARGEPVQLGSVVKATNQTITDVVDQVARMRGVYMDEAGAIIGFRGLSLTETPHRFEVDGALLHTWCALDTLFIPELLNKSARVTSRCPTTEKEMSLEVHPEGIGKVEPSQMVMSLLIPREGFRDDVISSFCHFIHFFSSRDAGEVWIEKNSGTFFLDLNESFEFGKEMNARMYGEHLPSS